MADNEKETKSLNETIRNRRSNRAISEEEVTEEELEKLLMAAHLAPSCFNNQPWRLIPVLQSRKLEKIKESLSGGNYWAKKAPTIIAVVSRRELDCDLSHGRVYYRFDCGLAVENLLLQATDMGLVAHPIAGFNPEETRKILKIPEKFELITLIVVGNPGSPEHLSEKHRRVEKGERERQPLDKVVSMDEFDYDVGAWS